MLELINGLAKETGTYTLYYFNGQGEYQYAQDTFVGIECPLPQGTTNIEPPETKDGYAVVFDGTEWHLVEDNRGTAYNIETGQAVTVTALGQLNENLTKLVPGQYQYWDGAAWVDDVDADAKRLQDKRAAMPALTPKQLKLVLTLNGLSEEHILSMIAGISDNQTKLIAEYEWRYALSFERTNPRTLMLASLMNLTDETVDELWGEAAKL